MRSAVSLLAVVAALTLAACAPAPTPAPDLNGTWGHQRVFGIDEVCPETLPDGSVRGAECASPAGREQADVAAEFPDYKPELLARVADLRARQVELDTVLRCHPPGVPRIGPPAKIVQTAREVIFLYDDPNGSFYRIIPVDGRARREGASSTYFGEAIGHFEGDTLVVETANLDEETWLTDNGAFHSRDLKVTERLRRIGETIAYQATADDPAVLAKPWVMRRRILRRSAEEVEEPPRCEDRDLPQMVDPSQFHENPR